jgi:DNA-binding transcriptional LysR family regulator
MELRHLRYFRAVAEEGHITRAAERLGIQQPPLSLQIKALETELGVQLLRRLPRGVELTDAGAAFYADICAVLADTDKAVARAQRVARGEAGRIAVGYSSTVISHPAVNSAIRSYRSRMPEVAVTLREDVSSALAGAVAAHQLDAAFIRSEPEENPALRIIELLREPLMLAMPAEARLAGEGPVSLEQAAALPLVLYRRSAGPKLYDRIIAAFAGCGQTPRIIQEAPGAGAALNLVAAGMGSTLVPQSLCAAHSEAVAYRPLAADPPLTAPVLLAVRKSESSPAVRQFISTVRRAAE